MDDNAPETVKVTIPHIPFESDDIFNIDHQLIASMAGDNQRMSPPRFFLGHLPMRSVDELYMARRDKAYISTLTGNFIVSGFFGGVWLRDEIQLSVFRGNHISFLMKGVHGAAFGMLKTAIGILVNTALGGSDRSVRLLTRLLIEPFLILNGYNQGYYDYIVKNPPRGVEPPEEYRKLRKRFLDWHMPGVRIAVLEQYKPVLDFLYSRKRTAGWWRWSEMRIAASIWKSFSAATGSLVWHIIMNESMPGPVYELLLDLSARFLLIAELCILPAMKCYADADIDAGRDALLQQAAMIAWAGSYMIGLSSNLPDGTFPGLIVN